MNDRVQPPPKEPELVPDVDVHSLQERIAMLEKQIDELQLNALRPQGGMMLTFTKRPE